jgi:hypothetical protein
MSRGRLYKIILQICVGSLSLCAMVPHALAQEPLPISDRVLDLLNRTPTGQALITRAQKYWGVTQLSDLKKHLRAGEVSRTDAVLSRHYNPSTGEEIRERQVTVVLKLDQPIEDIVLDLAHEFTHAVSAPSWDPYDPKLTPGKYIWASLEASGGEIDAVVQECQVALEISQLVNSQDSTRCSRYHQLNSNHDWVIDVQSVRKDFYRVGKFLSTVKKRLGEEMAQFPELSGKSPELYSATGSAPYPLALIREYDELNRTACENVRKRVESQSGALSNRSPASVKNVKPSEELLANRCGVSS